MRTCIYGISKLKNQQTMVFLPSNAALINQNVLLNNCISLQPLHFQPTLENIFRNRQTANFHSTAQQTSQTYVLGKSKPLPNWSSRRSRQSRNEMKNERFFVCRQYQFTKQKIKFPKKFLQ